MCFFLFQESIIECDINFGFFGILFYCSSIANFTLPSTDFGWFDEVIYTELDEEEAKKKVQEFNEKGKKALKERERERENDRGDRRRGMEKKLFISFHTSVFAIERYAIYI